MESVWNRRLDPEGNGDVDLDEWYKGMKRLRVDLTTYGQKKLFDYMDGDNQGYICMDDWVELINSKIPEHVAYDQKKVIEALRKDVGNSRERMVGLYEDMSHWDNDDFGAAAREMVNAMNEMQSNIVTNQGYHTG